MKTLDRILIILALFILGFIVSIEVMYYICGSVPDSLVTGVLGGGIFEIVLTAAITICKIIFKRGDRSNEDFDSYD